MMNCQRTKVLLIKHTIKKNYIFPTYTNHCPGRNLETAKSAMEDLTGYKPAGLALGKSITKKNERFITTLFFVDNVPEIFNFKSSFGHLKFVDINVLKNNTVRSSSRRTISGLVIRCLIDILRYCSTKVA